METNGSISRATLYGIISVCLLTSIVHFAKPENAIITKWDVYGYYVYLPGVITYADTKGFDFVEEHFRNYALQSGIYQMTQAEGDRRVPIYTNGLALLWSPFYIVAEGIAAIASWERDGLSVPYQLSVLFAAFIYSFIGLLALQKFLLRFFSDRVVAIVLLLVVFGTNYFYYLCFSPGMPHIYLFALHALVLFTSARVFEDDRPGFLPLLGAVIALACLIRPTEMVVAVIPAFFFVKNFKRIVVSPGFMRFGLLAVFVSMLLVLPQILLWKTNTGQWVFNAYAEAGHVFHFDGRHLIDGLFSFRKGWLLYTPVMALGVAGLFILPSAARTWRIPLILVVLTHIYVTFSWHMWWYANSFGSRPMIHVYPELAVGIAGCIALLPRKRLYRGIAGGVLTALAVLNLFQTWQYNQGILPGDHITKDYYRIAFFKTRLDRGDLKYLFTRRPPPGKTPTNALARRSASKSLSSLDRVIASIGDTCQLLTADNAYSFSADYQLTQQNATALSDSWIDVSADLRITGNDFGWDNQALMVLEGRRGEENLFWEGVPFQVFTPVDTMTRVNWAFKLPSSLEERDAIRLLIWMRESPDTVCLQSLELTVLN